MGEQIQVREGVWRTRDGREIVISLRDFGDAEPTSFVWFSKSTGEYETWLDNGRNTLSKFPQPLDLIEYVRPLPGTKAEPEPQPVQVREGVWLTRGGRQVEVRERSGPTRFRWVGVLLGINESWRDDGQWSVKNETNHRDLVEYVGPLPEQTTTDTKRVEICEGVWRTRDGRQVHVRENTDWRLPSHPWAAEFDGEQYIWMRDGRYHAGADSPADLVAYLRPLPKAETTTETLAEIEAQVAEVEQQDEAHTLRAELSQAPAARDSLEQQLEAMTSERDEVANELRAMTDHCSRQREQLESLSASRDQLAILLSNAQCAHDMMQRQVQQLQAELRQARIEIDAEKEAPANNCRAIAEGHLIGAQNGRQAAFEAVERWLEPLAAVDSEHAAAVLQALPGCIRKLAELEGVTL
jgi:hypothetical protein